MPTGRQSVFFLVAVDKIRNVMGFEDVVIDHTEADESWRDFNSYFNAFHQHF